MAKAPNSEGRLEGFSVLSRRRLLRWGLAVGGVAASGVGGLWGLRGRAPAVSGLRILTEHEYRTFRALASTIIPPGGAFARCADDFDFGRLFDAFLADEPEDNVGDLKSALLLVEYGPLAFDRRLATFSNLSPQEREAHWSRWENGESDTRRQVALAFRRFVCLVFYDQPEVWPSIGYEGPWIGTGSSP